MIYASACSGIEAASVAWAPLGWEPAWFAEIEPFPCAVLGYHYPTVPNLGDLNRVRDDARFSERSIGLLAGGTPCQSFSVAGLRKGLADPRGNLALVFLGIADALRPRWVVWENVPGVLSSGGGRDFGAFVGALGKLGYGWAYRILDAQYFGLAQRRKRVFVVGHLGSWQRAAAVLFERAGLRGDSAPRRQAGESPAGTLAARTRAGGGLGTDLDLDGGVIAPALCASGKAAGSATQQDAEQGMLIAHALRADGFDASEDGTGRGTPLVVNARQDPLCSAVAQPLDRLGNSQAVYGGNRTSGPLDAAPALNAHGGAGRLDFESEALVFDTTQITSPGNHSTNMKRGQPCHALSSGAHPPAIAMNLRGRDGGAMPETGDVASLRAASGGSSRSYVAQSRVRRLTPTECERLQGFPDGYTAIPYRGKPAADGPRYKALGNSMAVPVMRWIGERIQMVERITQTEAT